MIDMVNIVCLVLLVGILFTTLFFFYGDRLDDIDTF